MSKRECWNEYPIEEIEKWNTRELMSYFETIRAYKTKAEGVAEDRRYLLEEAEISLQLYSNYFDRLKEVLSTREHIPNKQEAKLIRQEKAKAKRNR
jgi:hypothetical protein